MNSEQLNQEIIKRIRNEENYYDLIDQIIYDQEIQDQLDEMMEVEEITKLQAEDDYQRYKEQYNK